MFSCRILDYFAHFTKSCHDFSLKLYCRPSLRRTLYHTRNNLKSNECIVLIVAHLFDRPLIRPPRHNATFWTFVNSHTKDEYGRITQRISIYGRKTNTAVFELVKLVGITSTMYTGTVFLGPYIKGFLFVNFLARSGVCRANRRTEP